jgi:hypothetical protein
MRKAFAAFAILVLGVSVSAQGPSPHEPQKSSQPTLQYGQSTGTISDKLPVTTSSADARTLYEAGRYDSICRSGCKNQGHHCEGRLVLGDGAPVWNAVGRNEQRKPIRL